MSAYVVILKSKKLIALQKNWVQTPFLNQKSLVFFSPNIRDVADFGLDPTYYFQKEIPACYESRVLKVFDSIESGETYLSRPHRFKFDDTNGFEVPTCVDTTVDLSSDGEDVDNQVDVAMDLGLDSTESLGGVDKNNDVPPHDGSNVVDADNGNGIGETAIASAAGSSVQSNPDVGLNTPSTQPSRDTSDAHTAHTDRSVNVAEESEANGDTDMNLGLGSTESLGGVDKNNDVSPHDGSNVVDADNGNGIGETAIASAAGSSVQSNPDVGLNTSSTQPSRNTSDAHTAHANDPVSGNRIMIRKIYVTTSSNRKSSHRPVENTSSGLLRRVSYIPAQTNDSIGVIDEAAKKK